MQWSDEIDDVLAGDQAVVLAYATPAKGVVLLPVTNFGLRDRSTGHISAVNSSVGVWKKLERIRANPQIALVYHAREHGWTERQDYLLVQGRARVTEPQPRYPDTIRENWDHYANGMPGGGRFWNWWLSAFDLRSAIDLEVDRIAQWPDLACDGPLTVHGREWPDEPAASQSAPRKGTGPRIGAKRAARLAGKLPHVLLGWIGADGYPVVVPVGVIGADRAGIRLRAPGGLVPAGGRRAGLTAHWFANYVLGERQRIHTGWLEVDGDSIVYAPHTKAGYWLPRSLLIWRIAAGAATRRGLPEARRRGLAPGYRAPEAVAVDPVARM